MRVFDLRAPLFLAAAALAAAPMANAATTTLTFGTTTETLPYSESGFDVTQTVGGEGVILDLGGLDNALSLGVDPIPSVGDTVEFSRTDGALFTLDLFDIISPNTVTPNDTFHLFGFVGAVQTQSLLDLSATTNSTVAIDPLFYAAVDRFQIYIASIGAETVWFDNFVLDTPTAVPLPAGLPLLLAAFGSFAVLRRTRA